jgi:hypothetical protein
LEDQLPNHRGGKKNRGFGRPRKVRRRSSGRPGHLGVDPPIFGSRLAKTLYIYIFSFYVSRLGLFLMFEFYEFVYKIHESKFVVFFWKRIQ